MATQMQRNILFGGNRMAARIFRETKRASLLALAKSIYYKIMAKHFQHFETTQGLSSVWNKVETGQFLSIIGDKSRQKDWN